MAKIDPDVLNKAVSTLTEKYDADVIAYVGFLFEPDDDRVLSRCRKRPRKRKNVLLILSTPGGSADAAYRIARCLQRAYKTKSTDLGERGTFYLYVHDVCKSAGTLLALGADCLIMSQRAELGPIDVQLLNEEEVGERRSGLAPRQAMDILSQEAGKVFFRMFRMMRMGGVQLPTRLATETAAALAVGLMEPVYAQLDPIRMGEIERSVSIANDYGERLRSSNVKGGTIEKLISGYPSHEFVIDRDESRDLFERVEVPTDELEFVAGTVIRAHHPTPESQDAFVEFLNPQLKTSEPDHADAKGVKGNTPPVAARPPSRGAGPATARNTGNGATRPRKNGRRGMEPDQNDVDKTDT